MSQIIRTTILRATMTWARDEERPSFQSGARTTFVVTRAVHEEQIGGEEILTVFGHRAEKAGQLSGHDYPGNEPLKATFHPARGLPAPLHPVYRAITQEMP